MYSWPICSIARVSYDMSYVSYVMMAIGMPITKGLDNDNINDDNNSNVKNNNY